MSKARRRGDAKDQTDIVDLVPPEPKEPAEPRVSWLMWLMQPVVDVPCMCAMPFIFGCAVCTLAVSSVWGSIVTLVYRLPPPFPRLLRFIEAGMRFARVLWHVCWGASFACASWFTRLGIGVFVLCMCVFALFFVCCLVVAVWITTFTSVHDYYSNSLNKQHGLFDVVRLMITSSSQVPRMPYF
jgi:hypothetical protein